MLRKSGIGQKQIHLNRTGKAYENLTLYASLAACVFTIGSSSVVFSQSPTTSALSILSEAPTIKMEDTQPLVPQAPPVSTPRALQPAEAQSGFAPRPAPTYNPVNVPQQPGYAGQSLSRQGTSPQGFAPPAPNAYQLPPNSPRPAPPNNEPREGFFKGAIRAIPFVGSKIAGPEKSPIPLPRDQSWRTAPLPQPVEATPEYQGLSTPIPSAEPGTGGVILNPPVGEAPESSNPYSPDSMREDRVEKLDLNEGTEAPAGTPPSETAPVVSETPVSSTLQNPSNILTVKVDDEESTAGDTVIKTDSLPKPEETPVPLDDPAETSAAKKPAMSESQENTSASAETAAPVLNAGTTEIVVQDSDLGMPNPAYEENTVILAKFQEAVKSARNKDYETAARQFREYATFHPSSGLTPRALFLSIIFEKDNALAEESRATLKSRFPENRYVKDADNRRPPVKISAQGIAVAEEPQDNELPSDKAVRLDKELTVAVGDSEKEPRLRIELAQTYARLDQYDRAMEVLRPALDMVKGKPEEPDALILLAECQIAKKDVKSAAASLVELMEKYPESAKKPKAAWNIGLVYEESGRYEKAKAIYNDLKNNFPDTQEAKWAEARLREISSLSD